MIDWTKQYYQTRGNSVQDVVLLWLLSAESEQLAEVQKTREHKDPQKRCWDGEAFSLHLAETSLIISILTKSGPHYQIGGSFIAPKRCQTLPISLLRQNYVPNSGFAQSKGPQR